MVLRVTLKYQPLTTVSCTVVVCDGKKVGAVSIQSLTLTTGAVSLQEQSHSDRISSFQGGEAKGVWIHCTPL